MLMMLCLVFTVVWAYLFFVKKNRFNLITYIWAGIVFPLILYLFNWSSLIEQERSFVFDYIIVVILVISAFYAFITWKMFPAKISADCEIRMTKFGKQITVVANLMFFALYLFENYLGSGTFLPGMNKIDIHTYSAPIISFITNSPYMFLAMDYYAFKATKKKKYIIFIILIILVPIISRSSRMQSVISIAQIVSLILFFESSKISESIKARRKFKKFLLVVITLLVGVAISYSSYTNYRMNVYGKYDMTYSNVIGYTGPQELEFISPYYGYFPLSFNNLKMSLMYGHAEPNYIGLYSYSCLYYGVLQLDNILGIDPYKPSDGVVYTATAATVPTGFWTFYYDYGYLFFIPILLSFFICYVLLKRARKEQNRLTYRTTYFMYIPLWFFMSFQNTVYASMLIVGTIIMMFLIKRSFVVINIDIDNEGKGIGDY